jgi:hypothetical protein
MCEPEELIALVSDTPWGIGVQCFALEDYEALADFVEKYMCEYIVK